MSKGAPMNDFREVMINMKRMLCLKRVTSFLWNSFGRMPIIWKGIDTTAFADKMKALLNYKAVTYVASGSNGMVFNVTTQGDQKIAVKAVKQKECRKEAEYHKMAHCKFQNLVLRIINCKKAEVNGTEWVFFEMPLMDEDLCDFMIQYQRETNRLTDGCIVQLTKDLMKLFKFFNQQGIVYGDLKPENLLVKLTDDGRIERIQLTDFDLSSNINEDVYESREKPWMDDPYWFGTNVTSPYITNQAAYDKGRATPELIEFISSLWFAGIKIEESIDYVNLGNLLTCLVDWKYKITNKWYDLNYFKHFREEANWVKFHTIMKQKEVSKELMIMIEAFFPKYVRENNWSFDVQCYRQMNWTTLKKTIDGERKRMITKLICKLTFFV